MQRCPKDGESLSPHKTSRGAVARCGACAGLWLPGKMVVRQIGQVARPAFVRDKGAATDLRCPDDHATLVELSHHGVRIDVCTQCEGVWLDSGELEHILLQRQGPSYQVLKPAEKGRDSVLDRVDPSADILSYVIDAIGDLFSGL